MHGAIYFMTFFSRHSRHVLASILASYASGFTICVCDALEVLYIDVYIKLRVLSDFMIAFSCPRGLDNPRERSAVYLARDVHFLGCGCGLLKGSSCSRNDGRMLPF